MLFALVDWLIGRRIPCLRRQVLVNFVAADAPVIRGVLWEQRGGWLVLKEAQAALPGKPPVAMDGDVVIECDKVLFVQAVS